MDEAELCSGGSDPLHSASSPHLVSASSSSSSSSPPTIHNNHQHHHLQQQQIAFCNEIDHNKQAPLFVHGSCNLTDVKTSGQQGTLDFSSVVVLESPASSSIDQLRGDTTYDEQDGIGIGSSSSAAGPIDEFLHLDESREDEDHRRLDFSSTIHHLHSSSLHQHHHHQTFQDIRHASVESISPSTFESSSLNDHSSAEYAIDPAAGKTILAATFAFDTRGSKVTSDDIMSSTRKKPRKAIKPSAIFNNSSSNENTPTRQVNSNCSDGLLADDLGLAETIAACVRSCGTDIISSVQSSINDDTYYSTAANTAGASNSSSSSSSSMSNNTDADPMTLYEPEPQQTQPGVSEAIANQSHECKSDAQVMPTTTTTTTTTGTKRVKPLPDSAVQLMKNWYETHSEHPYPDEDERRHMSTLGEITESQVKAWFANKRNRTNKQRAKLLKQARTATTNNN